MKRTIHIALNSRELAAILAALRLWQECEGSYGVRLVEIASNGGLHFPLSNDGLCERVNP
jgi:hypothetical protein